MLNTHLVHSCRTRPWIVHTSRERNFDTFGQARMLKRRSCHTQKEKNKTHIDKMSRPCRHITKTRKLSHLPHSESWVSHHPQLLFVGVQGQSDLEPFVFGYEIPLHHLCRADGLVAQCKVQARLSAKSRCLDCLLGSCCGSPQIIREVLPSQLLNPPLRQRCVHSACLLPCSSRGVHTPPSA